MTAPTVSRLNDNGAPNRAQGSFSGSYTAASDVYNANGIVMADGVVTISLGFVPAYVKVVNATDGLTQEWYKGMNSGDFLETSSAGVMSLETDDKLVVAVADTGSAPITYKPAATVTILVNGLIMGNSDTVVWVAEG